MARQLQDTCVCDQCHAKRGTHEAQGQLLCEECWEWFLMDLYDEAYGYAGRR